MSKRFRGIFCAYCAKEMATTGDHVFAREFFLESGRAKLPQAPACADCNNQKSKLEHYLTAVLPFGGKHADASTILGSMVPKPLRRNQKLHRHLSDEFTGDAIPVGGDKLERLFALIALGFVWYHWKVYVNHQMHAVHYFTISPPGAQMLDASIFKRNARDRVNENIGNGAFIYEGTRHRCGGKSPCAEDCAR